MIGNFNTGNTKPSSCHFPSAQPVSLRTFFMLLSHLDGIPSSYVRREVFT